MNCVLANFCKTRSNAQRQELPRPRSRGSVLEFSGTNPGFTTNVPGVRESAPRPASSPLWRHWWGREINWSLTQGLACRRASARPKAQSPAVEENPAQSRTVNIPPQAIWSAPQRLRSYARPRQKGRHVSCKKNRTKPGSPAENRRPALAGASTATVMHGVKRIEEAETDTRFKIRRRSGTAAPPLEA